MWKKESILKPSKPIKLADTFSTHFKCIRSENWLFKNRIYMCEQGRQCFLFIVKSLYKGGITWLRYQPQVGESLPAQICHCALASACSCLLSTRSKCHRWLLPTTSWYIALLLVLVASRNDNSSCIFPWDVKKARYKSMQSCFIVSRLCASKEMTY